jgi:outer membrane lipoprotein-sorting protein
MKKIILTILVIFTGFLLADLPDGNIILARIDENMFSHSTIATIEMTIHGKRTSKTLKMKSYSEGNKKSFSEYLAPPRDAGTKMLKLDKNLWIYDPGADRTIQISGHMLRQSMMGSDLSYEDMMEENEMTKIYNAVVNGEEVWQERDCWILFLTAQKDDVPYPTKKILVDKERFLPLLEERYGKSGVLLKTTTILEVVRYEDRWYPQKVVFKDMLKEGKGTEIVFDSIKFDVIIPDNRFSKAALRK